MTPPLQKLQHDLASVTSADLRRTTAGILEKRPRRRCSEAVLTVSSGRTDLETMPLHRRCSGCAKELARQTFDRRAAASEFCDRSGLQSIRGIRCRGDCDSPVSSALPFSDSSEAFSRQDGGPTARGS